MICMKHIEEPQRFILCEACEQEKIARLQADNNTLRESVQCIAKELGIVRDSLEQYMRQCSEQKKTIADLRLCITEYVTQIGVQKKTVSELKRALDVRKEQSVDVAAQVENKHLRAMLQYDAAYAKELNQRIDGLMVENAGLGDDLKHLRTIKSKELSDTEKEVQTLQNRLVAIAALASRP